MRNNLKYDTKTLSVIIAKKEKQLPSSWQGPMAVARRRGLVSLMPGGRPRRFVTVQRTVQRSHAISIDCTPRRRQAAQSRESRYLRLSASVHCGTVAHPHVRMFQMSENVSRSALCCGKGYTKMLRMMATNTFLEKKIHWAMTRAYAKSAATIGNRICTCGANHVPHTGQSAAR